MIILPIIGYTLLYILNLAILLRVLLWLVGMFVPPLADTGFGRFLNSVTEPIISPFRLLVPTINGIDLFSFLLAVIILRIMLTFVGDFANLRFFMG